MKHLAVFPLAALVVMGAASNTRAFVPGLIEAERPDAPAIVQVEAGHVVYDHCHGRSSGTAHPLCGTTTGGPAGGLF